MNEEQVNALARLKFRGMQVSIWQVAAQRPEQPTENARGDLAFREIWLRPLDTQQGTERGDNIDPCDHVGPLLCDVALRRKTRPARPWRFGRKNDAEVGAEWFGDSLPRLQVRLVPDKGTGRMVRVSMATVIPKRWTKVPEAAEAMVARSKLATQWLLKVVPMPETASESMALEMLRKTTVSWSATDPATGLVLSVWRSSGLVQCHVEWRYDPPVREATADLLGRLIEAADQVDAEHPEAFPAEPW